MKLSQNFLDSYRNTTPPFGFGVVGSLTYYRTYSRLRLPNGGWPKNAEEDAASRNEEWIDTIRRVVEGTFQMQQEWVESQELGWNPWKAQKSAQRMFDCFFNLRASPPGRGLWTMGSPLTTERRLFAALQNCGMVSTSPSDEPSKPYRFLQDMSMLGVGIGFNTAGAGHTPVVGPTGSEPFRIPDDREGWVEATGRLLDSYFQGRPEPIFDYSGIRPYGEPIRGFGGKASGPEPLRLCHETIRKILERRKGFATTVTDIVDIFNHVGCMVVAGNVRRSAEIAFGPANEEFLNLKNYLINPDRKNHGWASNNSILVEDGQDIDIVSLADRIKTNGEPGLMWLSTAKNYGRMGDPPDYADLRAEGANPCVTGDTGILTSTGIVKAADLVGVPFQAVVSGESYLSAGFFKTGDKPVFRLHTTEGFTVDLTDDHKVLTTNGFVEARNLEEGQEVVVDCYGKRGPYKQRPVARFTHLEDLHTVQPVYDCTVPVVHRFVANGIVVHNCMEQTLENFELCCLVENYLPNQTSKEEFLDTLKWSYMYAKTVTLGKTHWPETNAVMLRNRRIGCSITGVAQFVDAYGYDELKDWLEDGYAEIQRLDRIYSDWLAIPLSKKTTSVKPSGTVSLLAGTSPGMHWPQSRFYIRRIRLADNSPLLEPLKAAGYHVEKAESSASTMVVELPVAFPGNVRPVNEVSIWEQVAMAVFLQKHWADNQVSCTVTFDKDREGDQIKHVLSRYGADLKGISFLPVSRGADGTDDLSATYAQLPYEPISEERYWEIASGLLPVQFTAPNEESVPERFCDGDKCEL